MKAASAGTLASLAVGQYAKAELWQFDLITPYATSLYYTNWDTALTVAGVRYGANLILKRGTITYSNNLDNNQVSLEASPQFDAETLPVVGQYPIMVAMRHGYLDGAIVSMSKIFMPNAGDTSNGATLWFMGRVGDVKVARAKATISIDSLLVELNISMPRNIIQTGCLHTLFDSQCTVVKAAFAVQGTVLGSAATLTTFSSGLVNEAGYFNLGTILFTSGANAGERRSVKSYTPGVPMELSSTLPSPPAFGDTFTIYPGCDKQQATCVTKFNNLLHFRGYPYVPVPETLYDGGTFNPLITTDANTGKSIVGSQPSGAAYPGTYVKP